MKTRLPLLLMAAVAIVLIVAPFVPAPASGDGAWPVRALAYADRNFSTWFSVLAAFAFLLGAASLLRTHLRKVAGRDKDWPYSLITLGAFVFVLVVGLAKVGGDPGLRGDFAAPGTLFDSVFNALYGPLQATQFALLAFFIASAAYRAFRLRSVEAAVLLAAALVIMVGRTPLGGYFSEWLPASLDFLRIDRISLWIMKVPNTAGHRALLIGIALGVAAMVVRLLLGRERGFLGGRRPR